MGLEKLLYLQGVGAEFINCHGQNISISAEDRLGVLHCMLSSDDELNGKTSEITDIDERVLQLDAKPWTQLLPSFQHTQENEPSFHFYLPSSYHQGVRVKVITEEGQELNTELIPSSLEVIGDYYFEGNTYVNYRASLSKLGLEFHLKLGYHQLALSLSLSPSPAVGLGTLLVAPNSAFQFDGFYPPNLARNGINSSPSSSDRKQTEQRPWGVSIQLYSLRSKEQWGVGDFGDLSKLIEIIAIGGGSFIQLNPLHALDNFNHDAISPYSPSDRRRLNPLYIDVTDVDEYKFIEKQIAAPELRKRKPLLNRDNWLDYDLITETKYQIFSHLFDAFCHHELMVNSPRAQAFFQFIDSQGIDLAYFATELANQASKGLPRDPNFYCYLQFIAESQLETCQIKAKTLGMSIGLIRDLAVGSAPDGIEVKQNRSLFCLNANIGAPPDPFAPQGQNWGVSPLDPIKLQRSNFQHFIKILRSNMRSCGALRIDHVMALLRLWWCPNDSNLGSGAYVYYPLESLLAILCLESQRAQCFVIGEDLGIVPPELNGYLEKFGIYSNQLFYFCKNADGFQQPSEHKPKSLMMLANHDVPPLAAWWSASDLHLQRQIELLKSDEELGDLLNEREREKKQLITLFIQQGISLDNTQEGGRAEPEFESVLSAWILLSARSHSNLFSVQLCDLLSERHSVNIPGTWKEYSNWQRRLPYTLDDIAQSPKVKRLLRQIATQRA